jgi:hypothetical protein
MMDDKQKNIIKKDIKYDVFEAMYSNLLTYGILFHELTGREHNLLMSLSDRYADAIYETVIKNGKYTEKKRMMY